MNYQSEEDKKARRKLITIAISTVALILILIVAIVVVSIKKPATPVATGETTAFEEEPKEENLTEEKPKEETKTNQITIEPTISAPIVTETVTTMPTTGPEDFLSAALLLGSLTTFLTSAYLAKKSA